MSAKHDGGAPGADGLPESGIAGSTVSLIWAQTRDGVIGREGGMPWHVPEDLQFFKAQTSGHPVIMGRRTWESFPQSLRPLPGRTSIVLTADPGFAGEGAVAVRTLEEALKAAARAPGGEHIFVIGGGQVYRAALELADELMVTELDLQCAGDTYAPVIGPEFELVAVDPVTEDDALEDPGAHWHVSLRSGIRYRFERYWRRA